MVYETKILVKVPLYACIKLSFSLIRKKKLSFSPIRSSGLDILPKMVEFESFYYFRKINFIVHHSFAITQNFPFSLMSCFSN